MKARRGRSAIFMIALAVLLAIPVAWLYSQENYIKVYSEENENGDYDFYADSNHIIECFLYLNFSRLENVSPNVQLPFTKEIPAGAKHLYLFTLRSLGAGPRGYSISYSFARGNPNAVHPDPDYLYTLPYEHGTKHRVTQGYNGRFTHQGENEYALDFDMEKGTPVYAARGGLVAEVKDDSNVGGPSPQYSKYGNYILIEHSDGTFGNYVHLEQHGAAVKPGQHVETGQLIGYSGATGEASGPHLHFDVRVPTKTGEMQSIPVRFRGPNGTPEHPVEGKFYYSYHKGMPPFKAVLGSAIKDSDYAGYAAPLPATDNVDIRVQTVDHTYVVFAQNGYSAPVDMEVSMALRGMTSTTALPRTLIIPPRTELFLTLLRPVDGVTQFGYSYRLRFLDQN